MAALRQPTCPILGAQRREHSHRCICAELGTDEMVATCSRMPRQPRPYDSAGGTGLAVGHRHHTVANETRAKRLDLRGLDRFDEELIVAERTEPGVEVDVDNGGRRARPRPE